MMSDTVWISIALGHSGHIRPFENSLTELDQRRDAIVWGDQNINGEPLKAECFPAEVWVTEEQEKGIIVFALTYSTQPPSGSSPRPLPMCCGSSTSAAVRFIRSRCSKRIARRRSAASGFASISANKKQALLLSESARMNDTYVRNGEKAWAPRAVLNDGDIALSQAANEGPDIWIDPLVAYAFFVSDGLGKALKKAKAVKGFMLHKCRVSRGSAVNRSSGEA